MRARKRFGQNFLSDPYSIHEIISSISPQAEDVMVEIGPGHGALTKHLVSSVKELTLIEIDRDLIQKLTETFNASHLHIINQDVLTFDFSSLNNNHLRIVGNLPYNISTPFLFHLAEYISSIKDAFFMLQKEVVQRMTARPHQKAYGKLTVMLSCFFEMDALFEIPKEAFTPQPKITSQIVRLVPKKSFRLSVPISILERVVSQAFQMRRKRLSNSLKEELTKQDFHTLNIREDVRAENVTTEEYIKIAEYIYQREQ